MKHSEPVNQIPEVEAFFDEATYTISYVVSDPATKTAAIIDSVLDFDPNSGRTNTKSADLIAVYVWENHFTVEWILETHVHADHLSAAAYLKKQLGGETAIGRNVVDVQETFAQVFNAENEFRRDGRQFGKLFKDGEIFQIGDIECHVVHTPGHTPACVTYMIGDAAFVGDTLFMPDYG
ncbi:MAG: MBL fold metallo-hydrolase, partial [Rhodospirillales bacterium]|nr:MBL fold metallo-hydrolase [Rhodospirillales bacterium]